MLCEEGAIRSTDIFKPTFVLQDEKSKEMETPGEPRRSNRASRLPQRYVCNVKYLPPVSTNDSQVTEAIDDTPTSNKRRRCTDDTDGQSHTNVNLEYSQKPKIADCLTQLDGNTPKRRRGRPSLPPVTPAITQPSAVESEAAQFQNHSIPQHEKQLDSTPIGPTQYGSHRTPVQATFLGNGHQSSQDTIGQYEEQRILPDTLTPLGGQQAFQTTIFHYGKQQPSLGHHKQQQAPKAKMTQNGLQQIHQDAAPQYGRQEASQATMVQGGQQQDSSTMTAHYGLQHSVPAMNPQYVPRSSYAALGEYGKPPPPPMTPLQRAQHLRALADPQYVLKLRDKTTPMYGQHDPRATHNRFGQYIGPSTLSTPHTQHEPLPSHISEFSPAGEPGTQPFDMHPVTPSQNAIASVGFLHKLTYNFNLLTTHCSQCAAALLSL